MLVVVIVVAMVVTVVVVTLAAVLEEELASMELDKATLLDAVLLIEIESSDVEAGLRESAGS